MTTFPVVDSRLARASHAACARCCTLLHVHIACCTYSQHGRLYSQHGRLCLNILIIWQTCSACKSTHSPLRCSSCWHRHSFLSRLLFVSLAGTIKRAKAQLFPPYTIHRNSLYWDLLIDGHHAAVQIVTFICYITCKHATSLFYNDTHTHKHKHTHTHLRKPFPVMDITLTQMLQVCSFGMSRSVIVTCKQSHTQSYCNVQSAL